MYGKAVTYYIVARAVTQVVMFPIYVASIIFLEKTLKEPIRKYLYKQEDMEGKV